MARHVALLRAINLGAKRRVPMARLREVLSTDYEDVVTHLQSGNVVLTSRKKPATLERELRRTLSEEFGFDIPVVVRSHEQLAALVERDGGPADGQLAKWYLVTFRTDGDDRVAYADAGAQRVAGDPDGTARNWNVVLKLLELSA